MSKAQWHKVTDVRGFLAEKGIRRIGVHSPQPLRCIPWPVCSRCGLVYLKNEATRKAIKEGCIIYE